MRKLFESITESTWNINESVKTIKKGTKVKVSVSGGYKNAVLDKDIEAVFKKKTASGSQYSAKTDLKDTSILWNPKADEKDRHTSSMLTKTFTVIESIEDVNENTIDKFNAIAYPSTSIKSMSDFGKFGYHPNNHRQLIEQLANNKYSNLKFAQATILVYHTGSKKIDDNKALFDSAGFQFLKECKIKTPTGYRNYKCWVYTLSSGGLMIFDDEHTIWLSDENIDNLLAAMYKVITSSKNKLAIRESIQEKADIGIVLTDIPKDMLKAIRNDKTVKDADVSFETLIIKFDTEKQLEYFKKNILTKFPKVSSIDEFINEAKQISLTIKDNDKATKKMLNTAQMLYGFNKVNLIDNNVVIDYAPSMGKMSDIIDTMKDYYSAVVVESISESAVKASDLVDNETYFVAYKDMEAYAEFKGKKNGKNVFDNSGRKIELTDAEVAKHVTNESVNEAAIDSLSIDKNKLLSKLKNKFPDLYWRGVYVQTLQDPVQTHAVYGLSKDNIDDAKKLLKDLGASKFRIISNGNFKTLAFFFSNDNAKKLTESITNENTNIMKTTNEEQSYQDFFKKKLKKFGVTSIGALGDKKSDFFNEIEKEWDGQNEDVVEAAPGQTYDNTVKPGTQAAPDDTEKVIDFENPEGGKDKLYKTAVQDDATKNAPKDIKQFKSLAETVQESFSRNEAYTAKKAIADYESELQSLEEDKKNGEKTVETDVFWFGPHKEPKSKTISIDDAIDNLKRCISELKSGKVDPEDYNY